MFLFLNSWKNGSQGTICSGANAPGVEISPRFII